MMPVLGREVEESEQSYPVLGQAGDRLLVFGAVFVGEHVDGGLGDLGSTRLPPGDDGLVVESAFQFAS
jgi:hypothetical protein